MIDFDLAINEFDSLLKSNLNFRSSDALKVMLTPSGLEEVRAILHYQMMHLHLLIIGTRHNQLLIDTQQRALTELEILKKGYSLPNMIIKVQNILSKSGDGFSYEGFQRERQKYQTNLANEVAPIFYQVSHRRSKLRNTVSKKFSVFLTSVASTYSKVECSLRVLRAYKVKLLHAYCREVLKEGYHDAMKVQAIATVQRLRGLSQIFSIDEAILGMSHGASGGNAQEKPQVFKYEMNDFIENFFCAYNPAYQTDTNSHSSNFIAKETNPLFINSGSQCIAIEKCEIFDYYTLPSTVTLAKCETISYEESAKLNQQYPSFEFSSHADENEPEMSIK